MLIKVPTDERRNKVICQIPQAYVFQEVKAEATTDDITIAGLNKMDLLDRLVFLLYL